MGVCSYKDRIYLNKRIVAHDFDLIASKGPFSNANTFENNNDYGVLIEVNVVPKACIEGYSISSDKSKVVYNNNDMSSLKLFSFIKPHTSYSIAKGNCTGKDDTYHVYVYKQKV